MADQELHPSTPSCVHLLSALLAMEPTDSLISSARVCGGGFRVSERVQRFIWERCIAKEAGKLHAPYLKKFLKKLIAEVELNRGDVLDEIYEHYAHLLTLKDSDFERGNTRVFKCISFLFPDGCFELSCCPKSRKLMVPLQCSLNMFEGDTGCSLWPSSLFLSECILSFPELFSNKSCFEVGSGVGLVGICLAHVKASKVILSDGDLSTLANMKVNLELNHFSVETGISKITEDRSAVECLHLPWESVSESELQNLQPDIILGADVIYDPACFPHLVRVLAFLLNQMKSYPEKRSGNHLGFSWESKCTDGKVNGTHHRNAGNGDTSDAFRANGATNGGLKKGSTALIATVIRSIDTFNKFCALLDSASLTIKDLTDSLRPSNLLPYMLSYDRAAVRLFAISCN